MFVQLLAQGRGLREIEAADMSAGAGEAAGADTPINISGGESTPPTVPIPSPRSPPHHPETAEDGTKPEDVIAASSGATGAAAPPLELTDPVRALQAQVPAPTSFGPPLGAEELARLAAVRGGACR